MITLIFARKNYYLTYNSGMIPCLDYSQVLSEPLPYRIASDCSNAPQRPAVFSSEKVDKISFSAKELKQKVNFLQHEVLEQAVAPELVKRLQLDEIDINLLLSFINSNKTLISTAMQNQDFRLHSAKVEQAVSDFSCDDESFKQALNSEVLNNKVNSLKLHIALDNAEFSVYAGNKVLSKTVLQDTSAHSQQIQHYSLKAGDILLTTGSLVYAKNTASQCLILSFTQPYYIPSYDDRLYLTDSYFLSLPNSLSPVIRYDQVLITQEKYQHFQYNRRSHFTYMVLNNISNIKVKNKLLGNCVAVVSFILFAPVGLYFLVRRTKSKAKQALETY